MKNTTKKTAIEINAIENTIIVSKAFYKRASAYGSAEYIALREAMRDNPSYKISFKTIEKKTYNGLTFEKMMEYIKTQDNSDKMLVKFAAVKRIAKAKGSLYPLTKKWFLNAYPDYKVNAVIEAEAKTLTAELAAKAAEKATAQAEAEEEIAALIADSADTLSDVA